MPGKGGILANGAVKEKSQHKVLEDMRQLPDPSMYQRDRLRAEVGRKGEQHRSHDPIAQPAVKGTS